VPISSRVLDEDEEVLVDLRPHWVFLLGPVVLTAVAVAVAVAVVARFPKAPVAVAGVLAAMVAVPGLWLLGRVVRWLGISLVVTTDRIVYRRGIFSRDMVQLRLQRVAEVHCTQTIVDRLIGNGRVVVELTGEPPMAIDDVRRPRALQRVINRQLDELAHGGPAASPGRDQPLAPYPPATPAGHPAPQPGYPLASATYATDDTPPHGTLRHAVSTSVPPSPALPPPGFADPTGPGGSPLPTVAVQGPPPAPPAPASIPEQLIQLDDLRRRGIISDGEFEAKKAELLSRL
jgi:membrane protein YdbS with pleckstrin-like domain